MNVIRQFCKNEKSYFLTIFRNASINGLFDILRTFAQLTRSTLGVTRIASRADFSSLRLLEDARAALDSHSRRYFAGLYSMQAGRREKDASTIYLVTVSGSVAGDIDKSALSRLSISINHYNDPRAHSRQGSKYRRWAPARDVHHSVISRDLGSHRSLSSCYLLYEKSRTQSTFPSPLPHVTLSCPPRSLIWFVASCRECRREDIGP